MHESDIRGRHESFYPESKGPSSTGATAKLVTPQAFKRVKGLLDNTKGKVVFGGEADEATKYIAPTAVRDVHADDSLMSEYVYASLSAPNHMANRVFGWKRDLWSRLAHCSSGGPGRGYCICERSVRCFLFFNPIPAI